MGIIFAVFVLLILILTGTIVPVLFGLAVVAAVVLGLMLVWWLLRGVLAVVLAVVLAPLVLLGQGVSSALEKQPKIAAHPKPGDPDYLDWANRTGKYAPKANA